jgi:glycosyltransferase involved in cell wall biosynthesis
VPVAVSVVIPVHDGTRDLALCLEALGRSESVETECIIVDDASTEDVRTLAERHGARYLRLDRQGGPARARNRGAEIARGDILMFFDADVCVRPDTVALLERRLRQHPEVSAVIGSYDDRPRDPHFISQYKNLFHHYVHQHSRSEASTFWSGCGAIRRSVLLAVGGFDERYARPSIEDIELGARLCGRGERIELDPAIQVTHLKRWTLRSLVRTDVCDRAVPWLLLLLRQRNMPADLNLRVAHRLSVGLACLLPLCLVAALSTSGALRLIAVVSLAASAAALLLLNLDLYRFFARKRGVAFAVNALPLHWLYYAYCGFAFAIALPLHLWHKTAGR